MIIKSVSQSQWGEKLGHRDTIMKQAIQLLNLNAAFKVT